ncbi:MAG: SIR2 family NAD-dependent protein deacylase [Anaerolineales bacterium]
MVDIHVQIERAVELLRRASYAVALTGAGLSTPSGIPDFRSSGSGLWVGVDPFEVASLLAFRYHPERFYAWIRPLGELIHRAQPNPAHRALADLEQAGRLKMVITQNIDELHTRAGSRCVVELHGSLREATCGQCHRCWPGEPILAKFVSDGAVPHCADCGGVLKPNVILLGEELSAAALREARAAARQCDVMLVAGSSLEVMPAGALPFEAVTYGARLIIVNREPTYLDARAEVLIPADVAEALPLMAATAREAAAGGERG